MSNLNFRSTGDDCPICGGVHGGCTKTTFPSGDTLYYCYDQETLNSTVRGETLEGSDGITYKRAKDTSTGECSQWKEVEEKGFGSSPSYSRKPKAKTLSEVKKLPPKQLPLQLDQINKGFNKIRKFCGLTKRATNYLKERGLGEEEIEAGKYFSLLPQGEKSLVAFSKKNKKSIAKNFPGWNARFGSFGFDLRHEAIAIPILDPEGTIIGAQIRHLEGERRYTWWSSGSSTKNIAVGDTTEEPIGYCRPLDKRKRATVRKTDNWVLLTESLFKPFIASQKHQVKAIGASAFNLVSSPKLFKKFLGQAKAESPEPDKFLVVLGVDAGTSRNKAMVGKVKKIVDFVRKLGYPVKVVWYNQLFKPETANQKLYKGDIDEIERKLNRLDKYLLSPEEFFKKAEAHLFMRELERGFDKDRDCLQYSKKGAGKGKWKVKEINERYLSKGFKWDKYPSGIIAIKSPMNTGKTHALTELVKTNSNPKNKVKTALLGSRNALLIQTSDRIGATHKSKLKKPGDYKKHQTIALCVDSLLKLDIQDYIGGCLVLDEVESVVAHLLSSSTCKKERAKLFAKLKALVSTVLLSGGRIVLMDANLSPRTLRLFEKLAEGVENKFYLVNNSYQDPESSWEVELFVGAMKEEGGILTNDRSVQYSRILACVQNSGRPFICTDSKDEAAAISRRLDAELAQFGQGGLLITSETTSSKEVREFLNNPQKWLEENKNWCRYVAASPTIESGVSIEGDFFSEVFGLFFGNTSTTETQMQVLGRVRATVKRTIFINQFVSGTDEESPYNSQYKFNKHGLERKLLGELKAAMEINGAVQWIKELDYETEANQLKERFWGYNEIGAYFKAAWAELTAQTNFSKANQRRELKKALERAGHNVRCTDSEVVDKNQTKAITTLKQGIRDERSNAISSAPVITIEKAIALNNSEEANSLEKLHQIKKAFLQAELPGMELTPELVGKCLVEQKGRWLNNIKKLAILEDFESYKKIEREKYLSEAADKESPFVRYTDLPVKSIVYQSYLELGLKELVDPNKNWTGEELAKKVNRDKKNIDLCRNINQNPQGLLGNAEDGLEWANTLLGFVGLELVKGEDGSYSLGKEECFDNQEWKEIRLVVKGVLGDRAYKAEERLNTLFEELNYPRFLYSEKHYLPKDDSYLIYR